MKADACVEQIYVYTNVWVKNKGNKDKEKTYLEIENLNKNMPKNFLKGPVCKTVGALFSE